MGRKRKPYRTIVMRIPSPIAGGVSDAVGKWLDRVNIEGMRNTHPDWYDLPEGCDVESLWARQRLCTLRKVEAAILEFQNANEHRKNTPRCKEAWQLAERLQQKLADIANSDINE